VTGSVGKTSTKEALRLALSRDGETHASVASFNNHWGVPLSLARLPQGARYGVFEIGMNHPGEIEPLARQVEAHVGVITNVGPVHIGYMGSEEAIADEPMESGADPGVAIPQGQSGASELLDGSRIHNNFFYFDICNVGILGVSIR